VAVHRHTSYIVYFIYLIIVFFSLHRFLVQPGALELVFSYITYPFLCITHLVVSPIVNFNEKQKSAEELLQKLKTVTQQKELLQADYIALCAQIDFMHDIEELLNFKRRYITEQAHLTQVIFKQLSEQGHFFLLDAGSKKGIMLDMVALYSNCLIGRITEVYPYYSKLTLITDKSCKVSAYCVSTHAHGIAEGLNKQDQTVLRFVNHLEQVNKDDLVLSSGQGVVFPKGYALGKVKDFTLDGLYYTVNLTPLVEVNSIKYCYLLGKSEETNRTGP
jgi:rod shape-determining protein MreC